MEPVENGYVLATCLVPFGLSEIVACPELSAWLQMLGQPSLGSFQVRERAIQLGLEG